MTRAQVLAVGRLVLAVVTLIALIAQFRVTLVNHYSIVNYFSYFTTLSNIIATVIFFASAVRVFRGIPDTRTWSTLRYISTVNMVFVGLVFNTLLAGTDVGGVVPWVNVILHMLMPAAVLVDWLLDPPRPAFAWRSAVIGLIFPVAYSVYSLVRGPITGFYPYPFYNADKVGGVGPLVIWLIALIVALALLSLAIIWLDRLLTRTRSSAPSRAI